MHLEWLQNLWNAGSHIPSVVAMILRLLPLKMSLTSLYDIRRQDLYFSDYDVVQEYHVRKGQNHYPIHKHLSYDQLKETDPTFTDIFQRVRCEISILQHREQSKRIAIIYITGYAQEWLNLCFINDVRPFGALLPKRGWDNHEGILINVLSMSSPKVQNISL